MGIASGIGDNSFAPEREISRQELFTLVYKTLDAIGEAPEVTEGTTLSGLSDTDAVCDWAKEAAAALIEAKVISDSDGKLNPNATATRAEMALFRLLSQ